MGEETIDSQSGNKAQFDLNTYCCVMLQCTRMVHQYADTHVLGVLNNRPNLKEHEVALSLTYQRMALLVEALLVLEDLQFFQTVALTGRTIFELLLDIKLLSKDPACVSLFYEFLQVDTYRKRQCLKKLFEKHPALATEEYSWILDDKITPETKNRLEASEHYVKKHKHWSGVDLYMRSRNAGPKWERSYRFQVAIQSMFVHADPSGVLLRPNADKRLFAFSHREIQQAFFEATGIVAKQFTIFGANDQARAAYCELREKLNLREPDA